MPILNKMEKHLDTIDVMKENIKKDIEEIFNKLNTKNLISTSSEIIDVVIFAITEKVTKKYIRRVLKESQEYVKSVLKGDKKL